MDDGVGGGFSTVAGGNDNAYLLTSFTVQSAPSCAYTEGDACLTSKFSYGLDGAQYRSIVSSANLVKGTAYRFRYRAANTIGWSDWSPVSLVQAAKKPEAPSPPTIVSVSETEIVLQIEPSLENNGDSITKYSIYRDDGSLDPTASLILVLEDLTPL